MTANICGDSTWTITGITTSNQNGTIQIMGNRTATRESIVLLINNYEPGNLTFPIRNTGIGINPNYSTAYYSTSSLTELSISGAISMTGMTATTISGNFDFTDNVHGHITGTFTAPQP